jgi:hypothetical protein
MYLPDIWQGQVLPIRMASLRVPVVHGIIENASVLENHSRPGVSSRLDSLSHRVVIGIHLFAKPVHLELCVTGSSTHNKIGTAVLREDAPD